MAFCVGIVTSMEGSPPARRAWLMSMRSSAVGVRMTATTPESEMTVNDCSLVRGILRFSVRGLGDCLPRRREAQLVALRRTAIAAPNPKAGHKLLDCCHALINRKLLRGL